MTSTTTNLLGSKIEIDENGFFTAPNGEIFRSFKPRGKTLGKRYDMSGLLESIAGLFQQGFSIREVADLTGKNTDSISNYKKIISAFGKLESDKIKEPPKAETIYRNEKTDKMCDRPKVKEWIDALIGGEKSDDGRAFANALNRVCTFLKMTPESLLQMPIYSKDRNLGLKEIDKLMGLVEANNGDKLSESAFYGIRMAVRNWIQYNGITLPRGKQCPPHLHGRVVSTHGDYAHVKLTKQQKHDIEEIFENKQISIFPNPELFDDTEMIYRVGMATMARSLAIFTAKLNTVNKGDTDDFELTVIERKLSHVGKQLQRKMILDPKLQGLILARYNKGESCLVGKPNQYVRFDDMEKTRTAQVKQKCNEQKKIKDNLKALYKAVQVSEDYFYEHPVHSLRHAGCQNLLLASGWNTSLVAVVGGWLSTIEVEKSYGRMPPDVVKEKFHEAFTKANL